MNYLIIYIRPNNIIATLNYSGLIVKLKCNTSCGAPAAAAVLAAACCSAAPRDPNHPNPFF